MKVLCCGDRNWKNEKVIYDALKLLPENTVIIHGGARGADTLSEQASRKLGFTVNVFYANWNRYGKAAGPIRNRLMLDQNPDIVLAFHNNIQNSKGTKDCVTEAIKRRIPTKIIKEH